MTEPENSSEKLSSVICPAKQSSRWNPNIFKLLTTAAILAVLIAIILPAIQDPRGPSHQLGCQNNLKNIALALHNYAANNEGNFPPAYTVDCEGKPLHSWRTLILPYADQRAIYEQIDLSKPWNDSANAEAFKSHLRVYTCPSENLPTNMTTYLAIVSPNSFFRATEPRKLEEVSDDPGETLMLIDMGEDRSIPWMSPLDTDEQSVLDLGSKLKTFHPGGTNVAWVDGSVGFFDTNTSADERRAMISIDEATRK